MGRWKSDAYLSYIRTPLQELATVSKYLTSGYPYGTAHTGSHKLLIMDKDILTLYSCNMGKSGLPDIYT